MMKLNVKTLDGKICVISVDPNESVESLKKKAEMVTSVPFISQRLIFSGKVLKNDSSLISNGIKDESTVHMVIDKNKIENQSNDQSNSTTTTNSTSATSTTTSLSSQQQQPLQQNQIEEIKKVLAGVKALDLKLEENRVIVRNALSQSSLELIESALEKTSSLLSDVMSGTSSLQPYLPKLTQMVDSHSIVDSNSTSQEQRDQHRFIAIELTNSLRELATYYFSVSEAISSLQSARDKLLSIPTQTDPSSARVNQLFDIFSQINSAPQTSTTTTTTTTTNTNTTSNPNLFTSPPEMPTTLPNAYLTSRTFNLMNENLLRNGGSVGSIIDTIATSINPSGNQSQQDQQSIFGEAFQITLDNLNIPQILMLMDGDWSALDRLQPLFKHLFSLRLKLTTPTQINSASASTIERSVSEILKEGKMIPLFSTNSLPQNLSHSIKQSYDLPLLVLHTIQKFLAKFILLSLQTNEAVGFGISLKAIIVKGVEELMNVFIQSLKEIPFEQQTTSNHPVHMASEIIRFFLNHKLSSFLPNEFSSLGTNMVVQYIMSTFNQLKNPATNQALLSDPSNWEKVIRVDEIRQQNSKPQAPFSDNYLQASTSKRRKVAKMIETTPSRLLNEHLLQAIKNSKLENKIPEGSEQILLNQFMSQLSEDVKTQLSTNAEDLEQIFPKYPALMQFNEQSK